MGISSKLWITSVTLTGVYLLFPPFSSGGARAQYLTRSEFAQSRIAPPSSFRTGVSKRPAVFALQPAPTRPAAQSMTPVVVPAADPNTALGSALASCDKLSEAFEPAALPGARGEIKLDRCYRGRDHFVCSFGVLLTEARSLLENYRRITDANYPDLSDFQAVCRVRSETLDSDLKTAADFSARFKALKTQYDARVGCGSSIQQSFRDGTLSDMAQAPDLLKSMIDAIEADMNATSVMEAQVADVAEKIDASQKAMNTIQKVHRAMCARNRILDAQNRAAR
jgi:hypothetical protein